jgi:2-methylcitrate dehydratase PrpD
MTLMRAAAEFVGAASPPPDAIARARTACLDTIGVMLAGAVEPSARIVQRLAASESPSGACTVVGAAQHTSPSLAALANGTAAHALDFDDMCFVSLAHPSAPLVAAALAVAELTGANGRALLEAYVVGFELEAVLGRLMNPLHYESGWHCTSTLGTIGAAAAAARQLALDTDATMRTLAIAASSACGLKENFGTMVKPLHAGLAARNGLVAALLARDGLTASVNAIDGSQGFLAAFGAARRDDASVIEIASALGTRWEILVTGITVKLYPSCAATHPALDALLDLRRAHAFTAESVARVEIAVDRMTPTVLIYDRPRTGLEAKFSMPFCAAAAIVDGRVDLATFDDDSVGDARLAAMMEKVRMVVDSELETRGPALTQARVGLGLNDGGIISRDADGARGYPSRPARDEELEAKFRGCAARCLGADRIESSLSILKTLEALSDVRTLTQILRSGPAKAGPHEDRSTKQRRTA